MRKRVHSIFVIFLFIASCSSYTIEKNLEPDEKEFLSVVRFIITQQERKNFLNLPPSERKASIEEFWKKRDPDPDTEVNQYKEEYYKRVEEAKHLFTEGGTSGWLQDRGRVYILLGPPEQREAYPRGYGFYDPPMEIWHYGFHQLIFIDYRWNGNFELQPQSARMLAEINVTQVELKPKFESEKAFFDFNLEIKKASEQEWHFLVSIPYKNIWFSSDGEELKTTLEFTLEVFDSAGKKVLEESKTCPISVSESKLKELNGKDYLLEISFHLDPGNYYADLTLRNLTDKTKIKKRIKFTV